MRFFRILIAVMLVILLASCARGRTYEPIPKSGMHRVTKGESLYLIAQRYGLDYRKLAVRNGMKSPFYIYRGEMIYLRVTSPQKSETIKPVTVVSDKAPPVPAPKEIREPTTQPVKNWRWPARGAVVGYYSASNKGINIAGRLGQPIYAAASGKVIYCGHGLREYGNLIIIKHNTKFLTAYAYARTMLVSEGDWVNAGQKIAEMGQTNTHHVRLHFEIRLEGETVNPLIYLPKNGR